MSTNFQLSQPFSGQSSIFLKTKKCIVWHVKDSINLCFTRRENDNNLNSSNKGDSCNELAWAAWQTRKSAGFRFQRKLFKSVTNDLIDNVRIN